MNSQEMYEKMKSRLEKIVPDVELRIKAEIAVEIEELKVQKNAVILGHNYMEPALFYSIPDFTGDSLDLSRKAAQTDKSVIVFCGVRFMAETAKILNPAKTVLLPAEKAGCSLAASITAQDVRAPQGQVPGRTGGDLRQHLRGCEGRIGYLLHLLQRGRGGRIAQDRHGHLPAGRIPGKERRQRDRQAYCVPLAASPLTLSGMDEAAGADGRAGLPDDRLARALRSP